MQKNGKQPAAHAAQDRGFYIILILCAAAIAISGYVLFFAPLSSGSSMESVEYTPSVAQGDGRAQTAADTPVASEPAVDVAVPDAAPSTAPEAEAVPPAEQKPETNTQQTQDTAAQKPVWVQPVRGDVVQAWSGDTLVYHKTMGDWRVHNGVDYLAASGTRVYAVSDGEVADVVQDDLWGVCVTIKLDDNRSATYRGLAEKPKVKTGSRVKAGDVIGSVAAVLPAEADLGAHLHFELRDANGASVDPQQGASAQTSGDSATMQTAAEVPGNSIDVEE